MRGIAGLVFAAAVAVIPAVALAHGDLDQVNDGTPVGSVACADPSGVLFQSFTPSLKRLTAVDLRLRPAGGATATVRVVDGVTPGAAVLATATASVNGNDIHFDFAPPVELGRRGSYGLQLVPSTFEWFFGANAYPAGSASGCGIGSNDFLFRTYASPDERPPDTVITNAPSGLVNIATVSVEAHGDDDLTYPEDITFRCTVDGAAAPCSGVRVLDGSHTLTIAAVDRANKVDATPATASWTLDTTPPSKPVVRAAGRGTYRFTAAGSAGFLCAVDRVALHACGSRIRVPHGKHVLRVRARDAAGNLSVVVTARVTGA